MPLESAPDRAAKLTAENAANTVIQALYAQFQADLFISPENVLALQAQLHIDIAAALA